MYVHCVKRLIDILCALLTLIVFGWLFLLLAILVRINLGAPVLFKQPRPGKKGRDGKERIFLLYKFRTMTDAVGKDGKYRPDEERLTPFGKVLRNWSLDELPEAINILKGDMSVIGPRPQLVRDMVFMTQDQRRRHDVRPGLSGLAQVNGRNALAWDNKLAFDLRYIRKITFLQDLRIVLMTVKKVLIREGISAEGQMTVSDYGDVLLEQGRISRQEYDRKQTEAERLLKEAGY